MSHFKKNTKMKIYIVTKKQRLQDAGCLSTQLIFKCFDTNATGGESRSALWNREYKIGHYCQKNSNNGRYFIHKAAIMVEFVLVMADII